MNYEFLEHTSEVKFKAWGDSLDMVFESVVSAIGVFFANGNNIKSVKKKKIVVEGNDRKSLLYNFIDELVYLFDAENFIVSKGKVVISKDKGSHPPALKLEAELIGDDSKKYKGLDHIKAATYAEMFVGKKKGRWEVVAVVDV